jgi:hypothetical protein
VWEESAEGGTQTWIRVPERLEKEEVLWEGPLKPDRPFKRGFIPDKPWWINEKGKHVRRSSLRGHGNVVLHWRKHHGVAFHRYSHTEIQGVRTV